ncbi:Sulfite reductase [NADPH] flavoprotein component [Vanrija pseudolonga]|uniref:assimilatory sulfite reductase (NADPH) n=1 Tax=Vanrija pseudolonga TaxID=143232 RepID=A0AAF1BLG9_9TREE|nr:Sulfite reductase [NADPH] flavoprotein component [Vanrija pseudolonga]
MAPVAIASPPSPTSGIAASKAALLSGTQTPYSETSTVVSEASGSPKLGATDSLPLIPGQPGYIASLVSAQQVLPSTSAGATVFSSATEVLEALAVQNSSAVWVYDDAVEVGFGAQLTAWDKAELPGTEGKVYPVQTREGAGLELAGYAKKAAKGKISVFASTATLPFIAPQLAAIEGDVVIHVAATKADNELNLVDSLATAGALRALTGLPEDWTVVFSAGASVVPTGAHLYAQEGKVVHVVESTFTAREVTSYVFPSAGAFEDFTVSGAGKNLYLTVTSHAALTLDAPKVVLNTLSPSAEKLFKALSGATVTVVGPTRADAEALKADVLALLYSAPHSSTAAFPAIKAAVTPSAAAKETPAKVISFFTAGDAPLPQLVNNLFLSSPTLVSALTQYGTTSFKGTKSVLSLSTGASPILTPELASDLIWVSDATVFKHTDFLATAKEGASLVLELPWVEEDLASKLTAADIATIQAKNIRVFLLDLDASEAAILPIKEQVAFLLLYTGSKALPKGVWKVLDAFHGGNLGRDQVEEAQAGLFEIPTQTVKAWEVDPETVNKTKEAWVWDALANEPVVLDGEAGPTLSSWEVAARHILFREAFSVLGGKTVEDETAGPGIASLHPELAEETFLVSVTENRRLTPEAYDRNVFHLEIDTAGTGLKYEVGEAIGIHGWNDAEEVLDFCKWYGVDPEALISLPNPQIPGTVVTRTVFQVLQQQVDLFGKPGKAFYGELSKVATERKQSMKLKFISVPEGAELFQRYSEGETVNYADVLREFPSAHPSIEELVELIEEIKPRHYSIASSQAALGDKVELLIVTVDWVDTKGRTRYGQCTRYLKDLKKGDKVTVSIKPSVMKLPPLDSQPLILAGLGTGAAPFRAFMQHRAWQRSNGVDAASSMYFFGSRHRSQEYLYGEDIEAYLQAGILSHAGLAFSRDQPQKIYIQNKMEEQKKELARLLLAEGPEAGYFYLCGPTWPVPDVYEALVSSLTEAGLTRQQAEDHMEKLKEEERYVLEVY